MDTCKIKAMRTIFVILLMLCALNSSGQIYVQGGSGTSGLDEGEIALIISDSIANMKFIGLTAQELVSLAGQSFSPTHIYYVSNDGVDTNPGTVERPWEHHPWMSTWTGSTVLAAGDVVCMKRGDTWTISSPAAAYMTVAQSGSSGSPIVTTAYGVGNKPLVKIATATNYPVVTADAKSYVVFNNLNVQHHSSAYNASYLRSAFILVGSTNPCHDIIFTDNEIENVPFYGIYAQDDCYNIVVGDTLATTTATQTEYSNHIHDFGYAGVGLQGTDPTDSITNNHVYYNYIHDGTQTVQGENEYGIFLSASTGSTSWPTYSYVRFNRVENINTWEALDCHAGSYLYFTDNYVKNFGTIGILLGGMGGGSYPDFVGNHLYAERNTIVQDANKTGSGAFIQSYSSNDSLTYIYIRDNDLYYETRPATSEFFAIRLGFVDGVTVSGNNIYNGPTTADYDAIYISTSEVGFKNITIEDNFIYQWGNGININGGSDLIGLLTIRKNHIINPPKSCIRLTANALSATAQLNIYNNTLLTNYTYCLEMNYGTTAGSIVNIKNNIIGRSTAGTLYYIYWQPTVSGTMNIDNNEYWNSNNGYFDWGAARNWAYWTETLGFDIHSPNTTVTLDPVFVNASGLYTEESDFELDNTSPAIEAGTIVDVEYHGLYPDLGAIESGITGISEVSLISSAAADTTGITPSKPGDIYIDTSASKVYISKGSTRGSWVILNWLWLLLFIKLKRK